MHQTVFFVVHPTFRGILLIMFFLCETIVSKINLQTTSNRKLPNFYEKVTDFLWESYRISKRRQISGFRNINS